MRTTIPTGHNALAAAALAVAFYVVAPGCGGAADGAPPSAAVDMTADPLNLRLFDCTLYAADAAITMSPAVPQAIRISTGSGPFGAAYPDVTCFNY